MSISNFITNILQLQDLNINFSDKIITMKKKNILYNVISGLLTYTPDFCPVCGSINEKNSIIKYGTKSSDIKLLPFNGCPLILRLKKQRFLCTHCNHTFSAKTNIVEKTVTSKIRLIHICRCRHSQDN